MLVELYGAGCRRKGGTNCFSICRRTEKEGSARMKERGKQPLLKARRETHILEVISLLGIELGRGFNGHSGWDLEGVLKSELEGGMVLGGRRQRFRRNPRGSFGLGPFISPSNHHPLHLFL